MCFREGFSEEDMIFLKSGAGTVGGFWVTTKSKGTYTCKCASFKAFHICEHTLVHSAKENNLDRFVTLVSHKEINADGVGNMNASSSAGKKGNPRVRKGRCTDDNRPPLNYEVKLTGPLQATFTGTCIQRTPPKPSCPPTLGEPFLVKPVAGNIRTCFGCSLTKADMCVAHKQSYVFYNSQQRQWVKCTGNKHYHTCAK